MSLAAGDQIIIYKAQIMNHKLFFGVHKPQITEYNLQSINPKLLMTINK